MRSTAGPASFNVSRGGAGGQQIIPSSIHHHHAAMVADRPSTRHGSDERGNPSRPITQGISRRAAGLGQINAIMNGPHPGGSCIQKHPDLSRQKIDRQQSLNNQPIDRTYINQGVGGPVADVFGRRTSSRGMNRIYGGGSGSASFNQIEVVSRGQIQSRQTEKGAPAATKGSSQAGLETLKSLPAGFDPIFNSKANSNFVNENSHIKIKPMRLSKGFDSGEINQTTNNCENTFEATETSSFSALSRGTSIGAQESHQQQNTSEIGGGFHRSEESKVIVSRKLQQQRQTSPLFVKEAGGGSHNTKAEKVERSKRHHTSKGKVIASQSSHFRKKITSKNNRETAMESILEEDEHQVAKEQNQQPKNLAKLSHQNQHLPASSATHLQQHDIDIKSQLRVKNNTTQINHRGKETNTNNNAGSNGSTTMSTNFTQQVKNSGDNNGELSTMQTSGGFSNTRRSPRDPSFENSVTRGGGVNPSVAAGNGSELRLRPQLLSSATTSNNHSSTNYNSLHHLRPLLEKEANTSSSGAAGAGCQPTK